jgi:hypothetical protein
MIDNIRILLLDIDIHDRRKGAEFIENSEFTPTQLRVMSNSGVGIYTLSEFMDLCNDQEFYIDGYWVTYIRVKK